MVKNPPANTGDISDGGSIPGSGRSWRRAWQPVRTLAWRIPWTEEPGGLWSMKVKVKSLSHVQLFAAPWTVAYQAPPSMAFSSQEYWSGLPFPSLGDLPDLGIEPRSPTLQADALLPEPPQKQWSLGS